MVAKVAVIGGAFPLDPNHHCRIERVPLCAVTPFAGALAFGLFFRGLLHGEEEGDLFGRVSG